MKDTTDYTGCRFGRLVVLGDVSQRGKYRYVLCKCDCGSEKEFRVSEYAIRCVLQHKTWTEC